MKPARRYQQIPKGWTAPLRTELAKPKPSVRQQMAEFTGALDFILSWKRRTEAILDAAQNDDIDALLAAQEETDAWNRAVVAFADWRAAS